MFQKRANAPPIEAWAPDVVQGFRETAQGSRTPAKSYATSVNCSTKAASTFDSIEKGLRARKDLGWLGWPQVALSSFRIKKRKQIPPNLVGVRTEQIVQHATRVMQAPSRTWPKHLEDSSGEFPCLFRQECSVAVGRLVVGQQHGSPEGDMHPCEIHV